MGGVGTVYAHRMHSPKKRKNERVADTPIRSIRVDDALWARVSTVAKGEGDDPSSIARAAFRAYVADPQGFNAAVATIRGLAAVHAAPTQDPTP